MEDGPAQMPWTEWAFELKETAGLESRKDKEKPWLAPYL